MNSYIYPAGEALTFSLPGLYRSPREVPVEVSMKSSHAWPSEIQFNRDALRISGIALLTEEDTTYKLGFRAKADGSGERLLHGFLTIIRQKSLLQSFPVRPPMPSTRAQRHRYGVVESQSSSLPTSGSPSPDTSYEHDCLKNLRGESCKPDRYRGGSQ